MAKEASAAFRERLRELRAALGISQEELAERAALNYKHYQEIERGGKREVRFSTLVKLAAALRVPLYQLFTDDAVTPSVAEAPGAYRARKSPPRK